MKKNDPDYAKTMKKKENMSLWDSISESDTNFLKTVKFGARQFMSIDPQYQIKKMTEGLDQ
tara:strand:+ start:1613 stop:1795 length:183 start_codon:yes stop_codon:yes gene_type:complete